MRQSDKLRQCTIKLLAPSIILNIPNLILVHLLICTYCSWSRPLLLKAEVMGPLQCPGVHVHDGDTSPLSG